jgi:hypothetical protein
MLKLGNGLNCFEFFSSGARCALDVVTPLSRVLSPCRRGPGREGTTNRERSKHDKNYCRQVSLWLSKQGYQDKFYRVDFASRI